MADEASPAEAAEASRQERADRLASEPEPEPEQEPAASGGVEMPWDADSIAGASKGEIVGFLQANCSAEFLSKHKLKGQAKAITKKAKAPALQAAFKELLADPSVLVSADQKAAENDADAAAKAAKQAASTAAQEEKAAAKAAAEEARPIPPPLHHPPHSSSSPALLAGGAGQGEGKEGLQEARHEEGQPGRQGAEARRQGQGHVQR